MSTGAGKSDAIWYSLTGPGEIWGHPKPEVEARLMESRTVAVAFGRVTVAKAGRAAKATAADTRVDGLKCILTSGWG